MLSPSDPFFNPNPGRLGQLALLVACASLALAAGPSTVGGQPIAEPASLSHTIGRDTVDQMKSDGLSDVVGTDLNGDPSTHVNDATPFTLDPDGADALEGRLATLPELKRQGKRPFLSSYRLPDEIYFAGQRVPLENWQVHERVEYEYYQFLQHEGGNIIMAKRTGRCFPPVEKRLAEAGLPDDLKYMLLVESKCVSGAYSRARASGPWQFMRSTGKRYKLRSNKWRDERRNLEKSTVAAIKHLRVLKDMFGDWFLAMAAYNAGDVKIKKLMKQQKVKDYWSLHYVNETMRYVPRIIAAKEIFSQPERYLGLSPDDFYVPLDTEIVTVRVKKSLRHLASIAKEYGTYYRELKLLNPEIRRSYLPRGTHKIKIPKRSCPANCPNHDHAP